MAAPPAASSPEAKLVQVKGSGLSGPSADTAPLAPCAEMAPGPFVPTVLAVALIQDAGYQSLLISRRRQYHGEIARTLEERFPALAESEPDLVARHYTAAALPHLAIPFWLRAGERSRARFAAQEAITYFERGVQMARDLSASAEKSRYLLDLLLALGEALQMTDSHLLRAVATFKEAAMLAEADGSPSDLARAALGVDHVETNLGLLERESGPLLEAALLGLGEADSVDRSRVHRFLNPIERHHDVLDRRVEQTQREKRRRQLARHRDTDPA